MSIAEPLPPKSPPMVTGLNTTSEASMPIATATMRLPGCGDLLPAQTSTLPDGVRHDEAGMRLDVRLVLARRRERVFDDDVGLGHARFHVALGPLEHRVDVARLGDLFRVALDLQHVLMHERGAFRLRRVHVQNRRNLLVLHGDQLGCPLRNVLVVGCDGGHLLADETNHPLRKHGNVNDSAAMPGPVVDVSAGNDRMNAGQSLSIGRIYGEYPGVGIGAAQGLGEENAVQTNIGGVGRAACCFVYAVNARSGNADGVPSGLSSHRDSRREDRGSPPRITADSRSRGDSFHAFAGDKLLSRTGTEVALMEVKEAVRTAKEYLTELFDDEQIMNVGLEEVVFVSESNDWNITIGFSRPWDQRNVLATALGEVRPARSYKVLRINDDSGHIESLTDRYLNASN